jgi:diguanylate cyclase (GGDEF)-like protein
MVSYVIANAINASVVFLLWLRGRRGFAGTGFWLANYVMQFAAVFLLALRGILPESISALLGNGLVIAGTMLLYVGLERFVAARGIWIHNALFLFVFLAVHACFMFLSPNLGARNINLSLALLFVCGQCAWLMLHRADRRLRPFTLSVGLIFLAYCLASILRIAADVAVPPGNDFFNANIYDTLVLLTYQMLSIALTFSLFLMVNRRLIGDLGGDIAIRKRVEEILFLRLSLWEYSATHTVEELMQKALDGIQGIIGSPIGFYHFVEEDQRTLSLQAWSTRTLREFCTAAGRGMHYDLDQAGVWADCVRERRPIIHNDYSTLPGRKGMPEGHARVARELVVPTLRQGRVVSVLGVGNKPAEYDAKDVELLTSIADIIWTIIDRKRTEEKIRSLQDQLRDMAVHDSLTGLYNRHFLEGTLERELARAERERYPVSFIMIDIDNFKQVNDAFGHRIGDEVLRSLAALLLKNTRASDTIYRYGGEEFLVILPRVTADSALQLAEKWRMGFEGSAAPEGDGGPIPTISCGIASYPGDGTSGEELIDNADRALYRAKEAGRNRSIAWKKP